MKINTLTKEQREKIEKYEIGWTTIQLNEGFVDLQLTVYSARKDCIKEEIKRTIKRIENELEFLDNMMFCTNNTCDVCKSNYKKRFDKLKQELEDYKLMEELE